VNNPRVEADAGLEAISIPYSSWDVLIVDDENSYRAALAVMLTEVGIPCMTAASGDEALQVLQERKVNAVIADLQMPGMSGMELLAKVHVQHPNVVFLMATGVDDVRIGVEAMKRGAEDYLVKPLNLDAVVAALERALERKRLDLELEDYRRRLEEMVSERTQQLRTALTQIEQGYEDTLQTLGAAIDLRDSETAGHSRRVSFYAVKIFSGMGASRTDLKNMVTGALLHDIGKLATPDSILLKPGALTEDERRIMQQHVQIGYDLVKRVPFLKEAAEIVFTHHERCDGSGYPRALKAPDIPISARVFAIADTFDAMTSDRPYRSALPFAAAREEIRRGSGQQFDSRAAGIFLSVPEKIWKALRDEASTNTPCHQIFQ
jgi:putative nucleotidyltransferase with HDIG domain